MTPESRAWWTRPAVGAGCVAVLVFLPSLWGGFFYDDQHVIVDNRQIRSLGALGMILRYEPARPILGLSWALNYAVAGLTPWPYHLANVLIHAANAALVGLLFSWMAVRLDLAHPRRVALVGASLFAATPMAVETVAYVSSRSTALASFFVLVSLVLALPLLEGRHATGRRLAALAAFLLALATKEEAASLPLFLLLLDYLFTAGRSWRGVIDRWRIHVPFLALPVLGLVGRRLATGRWLPPATIDTANYVATQIAAFPGYLLRALVPLDPAFYRGHALVPWPPDALTLGWWAITCGLAALMIGGRRRWPLAALAIGWLAAGLAPSSSIVPLKEMVVDHRAYLGGAGTVFLLGAWLVRMGRAPVTIAVLALLAARSIHYEWVLMEPARAWEDAVRRAPRSSEAHLALGEAYVSRRDPRAEASFRRSIALDPASPRGWANLGALYAETGRLAEAESAMRSAARAAPWDSRMRDNLGLILQALGREEEALAEYQAAVLGQPPLVQPRIRLAEILIRRGEKEQAVAILNDALRFELDEGDARAIEALWGKLR